MTDRQSTSASGTISREEAQRRVEELLARSEAKDRVDDRTRRTRAALAVMLVILLLMLCGIGVFVYRLLVPDAGPEVTDTGDTGTQGIIWIRSIYGFGSDATQLFMNPNDAVTTPDGTIWITDPGNYRVVGFRGDGSFVDIIEGNKLTGEPFRIPSRVGADPDGLLYIVDKANQALTIMDGDTKLVGTNIPGITCVDADDEIIVVGSESGFAILDKDGNVQQIFGTRGKGDDQFDVVSGVALDAAARVIYVLDTYNNRLSAWSYDGERQWMTQLGNPGNDVTLEGGSSLETTSSAAAALQIPTDVTIDGNGRPMVLDAFDFSISAFDPATGEYVDKWGTYGAEDGKFMYPTGFDYDSERDWFAVADTQNLRAQIVRIDGTSAGGLTDVRSGLSRFVSGPARALWPCLTLLPLILILLAASRWRRRRVDRLERVAASTVTVEQTDLLSD